MNCQYRLVYIIYSFSTDLLLIASQSTSSHISFYIQIFCLLLLQTVLSTISFLMYQLFQPFYWYLLLLLLFHIFALLSWILLRFAKKNTFIFTLSWTVTVSKFSLHFPIFNSASAILFFWVELLLFFYCLCLHYFLQKFVPVFKLLLYFSFLVPFINIFDLFCFNIVKGLVIYFLTPKLFTCMLYSSHNAFIIILWYPETPFELKQ